MKDIVNIVLHPIRMRIVQVAAKNQTIKASVICDTLSDVPRTTVYRHIKRLIDNDILTVVSETKIRGSLERTLSLNTQELVKQNTLENATQNAFAFLMNRYARFENYFSGEAPDPAKDRLFLNTTVLMATDEEFDCFLKELQMLLLKYSNEYAENRKPRDISIISAPDEKERSYDNDNDKDSKERKKN